MCNCNHNKSENNISQEAVLNAYKQGYEAGYTLGGSQARYILSQELTNRASDFQFLSECTGNEQMHVVANSLRVARNLVETYGNGEPAEDFGDRSEEDKTDEENVSDEAKSCCSGNCDIC